jgi:hypothetical protein
LQFEFPEGKLDDGITFETGRWLFVGACVLVGGSHWLVWLEAFAEFRNGAKLPWANVSELANRIVTSVSAESELLIFKI